MTMKWFKLYHELSSDPKLLRLSAAQMWGVVLLLIEASKADDRGAIGHELPELAVLMRCTEKDAETLVSYLVSKRFLEREDGGILRVVNWEKYQSKDAFAAERMRKMRKRKKQEAETKRAPAIPETGLLRVTQRNVTNVTPEEEKREEYILRNDVETSFARFWDAYGKKVDRKKCIAKWAKMKESERTAALAALPAYLKSKPDLQYRKNPLTWLNGECWNDQLETDKPKHNLAQWN